MKRKITNNLNEYERTGTFNVFVAKIQSQAEFLFIGSGLFLYLKNETIAHVSKNVAHYNWFFWNAIRLWAAEFTGKQSVSVAWYARAATVIYVVTGSHPEPGSSSCVWLFK